MSAADFQTSSQVGEGLSIIWARTPVLEGQLRIYMWETFKQDTPENRRIMKERLQDFMNSDFPKTDAGIIEWRQSHPARKQ